MSSKYGTPMTVKEYAALRNISTSAVTEALRMGWNVPGVESVEKFNGDYLLTVDVNAAKKARKKRK